MTLRLLVVAPTYWPLADDRAMRLLHWSSGLLRNGIQSTILTSRWHTSWPANAVCREVPVVRLLPPPKTAWSQSHFLRSLGKWVAQYRKDFDAIYVDDPFGMLHQLAQPRVLQGLPIVGRFHAAGIASQGEFDAATSLVNGAEACRKLTKVVVPDAASDRRVRSIGIPGSSIERIPDVAWVQVRKDSALRQLALHAFAKISGDLVFPHSDRLIVCFGELTQRSGVGVLAKAIGKLLDEGKGLTVWMIGEGSDKHSFYESLRDQSWHRDILLQGGFDSIEELLQVADLCIFPGEGCSTGFYFPAVVASSVPWIAANSSDVKAAVGHEDGVHLFTPGDWKGLSKRIESWMKDPIPFENAATAARNHFLPQFAMDNALDLWSKLLHEITKT